MQKPNEAGQTGQVSKTCPVSRLGLSNYPTLKEIGGTCPADTKVLSQNAFSLGSSPMNLKPPNIAIADLGVFRSEWQV